MCVSTVYSTAQFTGKEVTEMEGGLTDAEFRARFGCSPESFAEMKPWQQRQLGLTLNGSDVERRIRGGRHSFMARA